MRAVGAIVVDEIYTLQGLSERFLAEKGFLSIDSCFVAVQNLSFQFETSRKCI